MATKAVKMLVSKKSKVERAIDNINKPSLSEKMKLAKKPEVKKPVAITPVKKPEVKKPVAITPVKKPVVLAKKPEIKKPEIKKPEIIPIPAVKETVKKERIRGGIAPMVYELLTKKQFTDQEILDKVKAEIGKDADLHYVSCCRSNLFHGRAPGFAKWELPRYVRNELGELIEFKAKKDKIPKVQKESVKNLMESLPE